MRDGENTLYVQKKAVRIITFSKLDSYPGPLFKSLGIIKFFHIALFQIAIFMYKFHNNVLPAAFHCFFLPRYQVFIIIILGLQQNTLTIFLMQELIMANLISVFKVHLSGILLMIM